MDEHQQPRSRIERLKVALQGDRDRMLDLSFFGQSEDTRAALGGHRDIWHRYLLPTLAKSTSSRLNEQEKGKDSWVGRTPAYGYCMPPFNRRRGYNVENLLAEAPLASALDAIPEDDFERLISGLYNPTPTPRVLPLNEDDLRLNVYWKCADRLAVLFRMLGLKNPNGNLFLIFISDEFFDGPEKSDIQAKTDAGWFLCFNDGKKARAIPLLTIELKNIEASVTAGGHFSGLPDLFRSQEEQHLLQQKRQEITDEVMQSATLYAMAGAQLKIANACEEFSEAMHQSAAVAIPHGGTVWAAGDPGGLYIVEQRVPPGIPPKPSNHEKPATLRDLHTKEKGKGLSNTQKRMYDLGPKHNWFTRYLHQAIRFFIPPGPVRRVLERLTGKEVKEPPKMEFSTVICLHNEDAGDIEYVILLVLFNVLAKNLPGVGNYWDHRRDAVRAYDEKRRGETDKDKIEILRDELNRELNRIAEENPTFEQGEVLQQHTQRARDYFHEMWNGSLYESAHNVSSRVGGNVMCSSDFKWLDPLQKFLRDDVKSSDVYKCSTPKFSNGETIVLKLLHPDNSGVFLTELRALKRLNSVPSDRRYYWPKLYSWGVLYNEDMRGPELGVHFYIAMEYIKARPANGNGAAPRHPSSAALRQPSSQTPRPPYSLSLAPSTSRVVSTGSTLSSASHNSANTVTTDETSITCPSEGIPDVVGKFAAEEESHNQFCKCYNKLMEQGVDHDDLRESNVIYTVDAQGPLAKAIDFGQCVFLFDLPGEEVFKQSQGDEDEDEDEVD